jgi:hypothetical protein
MISTVLCYFGLFIFEKCCTVKVNVNVNVKSDKQKHFFKKLVFCWRLEGQ